MKLIIARHGETISNNDDLLQGQLDGQLSEKGRLQAQALAQALKNEAIDCIYCSDLNRASDTAAIIAEPHNVAVEQSKEVRERSFGVYEGTSRSHFYAHERGLSDPYNNQPEQGESFTQLYWRAERFLNRLLAKHLNETVLLVSHGDFARMCLGILSGKDVKAASQIHQSNGCINVLRISDGMKAEFIALNDTGHLGKDLLSHNKSSL